LIELVRQLGRDRFERPLRFVFFPNEEPPFFPDAGMGSAAYASELRHTGVDVHVMIALEMLGYYSDRPPSSLAAHSLAKASQRPNGPSLSA
jgi:hypothetical protein